MNRKQRRASARQEKAILVAPARFEYERRRTDAHRLWRERMCAHARDLAQRGDDMTTAWLKCTAWSADWGCFKGAFRSVAP